MNSFAGLGGEDDTWNADTTDVNSCLIGRKGIDLDNAYYQKIDIEPPRLYRRVDCLSQAALSDSQRLS